jgi:hypothetical protein
MKVRSSGSVNGVGVLQVGRHHQGGLRLRSAARREVDLLQQLGEGAHLPQVRLGRPGGVGQPEMHLERVVPVGVLVGQAVVVGVVPGDPARRPGQQGGVQDLAVVVAGVVGGGEVGGHAELLEHDRLAREAGQLADEGGPEVLADQVGLHAVDVGAEEVDQRRRGPDREPVVDAAHLDAPGAVAQ